VVWLLEKNGLTDLGTAGEHQLGEMVDRDEEEIAEGGQERF
jgi:hypothetical protein